jgi:hypothetical protein
MRMHRFGGKEVLQADDVEPPLPDASQVLVVVRAASVNPVDFKIRFGKYRAVKDGVLITTLTDPSEDQAKEPRNMVFGRCATRWKRMDQNSQKLPAS